MVKHACYDSLVNKKQVKSEVSRKLYLQHRLFRLTISGGNISTLISTSVNKY